MVIPRKRPGGRIALPASLALAILLAGCAAGTGVYHRVEKGQTAYRIARTYGIDVEDLLFANRIIDPRELRAGQLLWIPGASGTRSVPTVAAPKPDATFRLYGKRLVMPLHGVISSGFGMRSGRMHEGIDILAERGAEVRAAGYGVVVYAGNGMRGYGNAIVLDHGNGVTTLYGHLDTIRVQSGDAVAPGSVLGEAGDTGNASTTHLHFELQLEGEGVDPERYLEKADRYR